jgi:hypothetical protein
VLLVYATIAINSCADPANAAVLDAQLTAAIEADVAKAGDASVWLQQPAAAGGEAMPLRFGCAQVRLGAGPCMSLACSGTYFVRCRQHAARQLAATACQLHMHADLTP